MTIAEFKRKWSRYRGKESSAYQEHFNDLCRLLGHPTPVEADPSGEDFFCFQKGVIKDLESLDLEQGDQPKKGIADVWKKGCFGWEYKGKHKDLGEAYQQLQRYREALLNPPLLIVCDFDRYILKTNFNGTVQEAHEFTNDQIDRPDNWRILRACFEDPDYLKPQRTTAQVTEHLAETIAEVAKSLQKRQAVELVDAKTRAEMNAPRRTQLRIARFLNRVVFCFFAEDTGLLPKNLFTDLLKTGRNDRRHLAETLENLFAVMAKGGAFGKDKIRQFNGHLFEDATVFELTDGELRHLIEAGEADWQFIQPSIMGTLFERALEPEQRSQLGAHYTSEADIKTLVEPVLMAPLRREWTALKEELAPLLAGRASVPASRGRSDGTRTEPRLSVSAARGKLAAFQKRLAGVTVLDPACGSGNFLYVSLQLLLDLEKVLLTFAMQLGVKLTPQVSVPQLAAIEINPYAFELAQVSVQIGYLQWRRDNGFDNDRSPVLQTLDGFQNEDALLVPHFRGKARTLKEAQAGEHAADTALKFYTERPWPKCDVILSNPPFMGGKLLRRELGDAYVDALFENFGKKVRPEADLCCYWFEKARKSIESRKCKRAGLLATQGIRGGASRDTIKRIKETGDIFFAESDRDWILAGANVHVSMIGFDDSSETVHILDGKTVEVINANLTAFADVTRAREVRENASLAFMGTTKGGAFDIPEALAIEFLRAPSPHGKPNSDVVVPWVNGLDLTQRPSGTWIIDYGVDLAKPEAAKHEVVFNYVQAHVKPQRDRSRTTINEWWLHERRRGEMRLALAPLPRFLCTTRVSKHRLFVWLQAPTLPDSATFAFARADDYFFGVLHSRLHEVWARAQGTQVRERESGFRYTPTTCFETFPFPFPDDLCPPEPAPAPPSAEPEPMELNGGMANMVERRFLRTKEEPPPYLSSGGSRRKEAPPLPSEDRQRLVTSTATKEEHRAIVAAAAKELNDLRERWLNPPEWTATRFLEFPGTVGGPWDRYIVRAGEPANQSADDSAASPSLPFADSPSLPFADSPAPLIGLVRYPRLEPRDAECAAKLKQRTLTNLYNERPAWLDLAHRKLDATVAAAYGWPADLTDEQILERLLALNLERAAEEANAVKIKKPKVSREKTDDELL